MKKIFFLFVIFNHHFGTAVAQALPPGNYQQSCKNIELNGGTLSAMCDGAPPNVMTYLDHATSCSAPIENVRGNLLCPTRRMLHAVIPDGLYTLSCRNIELFGGYYLEASCPNFEGDYLRTELNLGECQSVVFFGGQARGGDIQNMNGQLNCL